MGYLIQIILTPHKYMLSYTIISDGRLNDTLNYLTKGHEYMYDKSQACMDFSNYEIVSYLVKPLLDRNHIVYAFSKAHKRIHFESDERIFYIEVDREAFVIMFYILQTSLYILDSQILFLDERQKRAISISDTYGEVVYLEELNQKNHMDILNLILSIVVFCEDACTISIEEEDVCGYQEYNFPNYQYTITVTTKHQERARMTVGNLLFIREYKADGKLIPQ